MRFLTENTIFIELLISAVSLIIGSGILTYKFFVLDRDASVAKARNMACLLVVSLLVILALALDPLMQIFSSARYGMFFPLTVGFSVLIAALMKSDKVLIDACQKYKSKNYQGAVDLFEQRIAKQPNKQDLYLWCAFSYYYLHQYEKCISVCDRLLTISPNNFDAQFHKAQALIEIENLDKSLTILNKLAEQRPRFESVYIYRAYIHYLQYQFEKALEDLDRVKKPSRQSIVQRCMVLVELNQHEVAFRSFHDMMQNFKEKLGREEMATLMAQSGWLRVVERRYDTAIQELTLAHSLDPNNSSALLTRAFVYLVQNKFDLARGDIALVKDKDIGGMQRNYFHYVYSILLWRTGDLSGAIENAAKTLGSTVERSRYLSYNGLLQIIDGRLEEARIYLDKAIELNPHDAEAHYNRSSLFEKMGLDKLAAADRAMVEEWSYRPYFEW